ncbi:hypothetical protein [Daejeonella oryzae]|uniref:hypothetical protein n=1 Tax=Daejeonella oryzae TaxID=1122943 RepID=UPI0012DCB726|nr:hypothetical protein [Daejeonella oryzae]
MRFILLSFCLVFFHMSAFSENSNPSEILSIKEAMYRAVESPKVTDSLYAKLINKKSKTPLLLAYVGTLEALKAKHAWNPYHKLKYVAQAQKTLKSAVSKDPSNMEIRFMRFSIQHYTPAFLGYSKELDEDRREIIRQFKNRSFGVADQSLVNSIARFMIESKRCSPADLLVLKKFV